MTLADILKLQYGTEEEPPLSAMYWCEACGCASKIRVVLPNHQLACPVCLYEAQRAHMKQMQAQQQPQSAEVTAPQPVPNYEQDICEQQRRMYRYKRSERAFKDFLLEVKRELDEEEFVEMCRDYYQTDW